MTVTRMRRASCAGTILSASSILLEEFPNRIPLGRCVIAPAIGRVTRVQLRSKVSVPSTLVGSQEIPKLDPALPSRRPLDHNVHENFAARNGRRT